MAFSAFRTEKKYWFLVFGILHSVRGKFPDGVSGAAVGPIFFYANSWPVKMRLTAAPETSSGNLPRTPCKIPKTKNQHSFHGESLKSGKKLYLNTQLSGMYWDTRGDSEHYKSDPQSLIQAQFKRGAFGVPTGLTMYEFKQKNIQV